MPAILLTLRSGCSQKRRGAGGVSISVSLWREHTRKQVKGLCIQMPQASTPEPWVVLRKVGMVRGGGGGRLQMSLEPSTSSKQGTPRALEREVAPCFEKDTGE